MHKNKYTVNLKSLTDLEEFISEVSSIKGDINAKYGIRIVDAKSFLGMADISQYPIVITLISDDTNDISLFNEICRKYEVK